MKKRKRLCFRRTFNHWRVLCRLWAIGHSHCVELPSTDAYELDLLRTGSLEGFADSPTNEQRYGAPLSLPQLAAHTGHPAATDDAAVRPAIPDFRRIAEIFACSN